MVLLPGAILIVVYIPKFDFLNYDGSTRLADLPVPRTDGTGETDSTVSIAVGVKREGRRNTF